VSGSLPLVPWATRYGPKFRIRWASHSGTRLGPTHPLPGDGPTYKGCTYRTPTKDEPDKMANHVATPPSSDYVRASRFQHLEALSIHLKRKPRPLYTKGLLDLAKYHPTRVSRSVSPNHRPQWDVALGAHAPLAQGTQAGIYSIASSCRITWGARVIAS
jgi:hypothetical protein